MANQSRNDVDTRMNDRSQTGQGSGSYNGGQDWSATQQGNRQGQPYAAEPGTGREEFYRRAETARFGRGETPGRYRGQGNFDERSGAQGGSNPGRGYGAHEAEMDRTRGYGDYYGRAGEGYRTGYGERDPNYERGRDFGQHAGTHSGRDARGEFYRGPQYDTFGRRGYADQHEGEQHPFDRARMGTTGYGDYGHPGEGNRMAYGDMGMAHGGRTQGRGADRGGLLGRLRRWRQGAQTARDVMTKGPKTIRPTETVQQIAQIMVDEDCGIVPVCDEGGRLLGVVTDRDVVCRLIARGVDMKNAKASDVMTNDVECVTEQDTLQDVLRIMAEHQIRRVPVVSRGDKLVGIISMADLAREADVDEELQDAFEEISSSRGFWARLR